MPDRDEIRTAVIVEDDRDLRHLLTEVFESAGFSAVTAGNGIDGVKAVLAYKPLITTLDVSMPGIDGIEAARRIREAGSETFIMMITAMGDETDVVLGLSAGADDYIVKPFRPREFRARLDAFLRRPPREAPTTETRPVRQQERPGPSFPRTSLGAGPAAPPAPEPAESPRPVEPAEWLIIPSDPGDVVVVGELDEPGTEVETRNEYAGWIRHLDLHLDPESRRVVAGGRPIELTPTEFELLHTVLESRRRVRSKADLTLVLRGESYVTSYFVGDADKLAVETNMTSLRRKLGDLSLPQPRYLEAVRDIGYRLTPERDDED